MIDLRPVFKPSFWFDLFPQALSPSFQKGFFLLFGLMVIVGAIMRMVRRKKGYDKATLAIYKRISNLLVTMGVLGMIWFFFTFEEIYLFGSRFWFLIWIVALVVWIYLIVRFVRVDLPKAQGSNAEVAMANKYLPRKRKK